MGILDFSKSELNIKFHEPPPLHKWEFWILANLNSTLNSANPPPPYKWEFWILANLNSTSNSATPPPPHELVNARTTLSPRPGAPRLTCDPQDKLDNGKCQMKCQ